jgi:hypothetical protein
MCKQLICLTSLVLALVLVGSAGAQPTGEILVEWWLNFGGNAVADVLNNPDYPDNPDGSTWLDVFEVPQGGKPADLSVLGDNYGARLRGYLYPPADGDYTFWITGDNGSDFLLSTDEDPANAIVMCQVPGTEWTGEREWDKYPDDQKSDPVTLTAGTKYYVEAIYKEGGGGDGVAIGWGGPTIGEGPEVIEGQYLSQWVRPSDLIASNPVPADGDLLRDTWVNLQWSAAPGAVSHDVYLGESFAEVNDGTGDTFRINQTGTMFLIGFFGFPYPDGLVPGTTYYWRIDEIEADATVQKGDVWSFMIPPRKAFRPDPPDGGQYVGLNATLNWTAGFGARMHYVNFGDNFDDVNNAVGGFPTVVASYTPGTLELEKTYYWRVDESDGPTTLKGDVWSFTTLPVIPIANPNLVGWWKFDKGYGTNVVDWSGHGNHGAIQGDPRWVTGQVGGALELDGAGDYVDCGNDATFDITAELTLAVWVNANDMLNGQHNCWLGKGDNAYAIKHQSGNYIEFFIYDGAWNSAQYSTNLTSLNGEWHHMAGTYDGSQLRFYLDGQLEVTLAHASTIGTATHPVTIGENSQATGRFFDGLIDDARIYNKALTLEEIQDAMRGDPLLAWNASPKNNATVDVGRARQPLTWSPGDNAAQHDVYFGTDKDAVRNADASDATGIYRGRQTAASYSPPEPLEWGTGPYYWRIDEFNTDATISTGNIWSFAVGDFLVVDDFESYNDIPAAEPGSNLVYLTWQDGYDNPATNGSTIGYTTGASMETDTVHGGLQSVPYAYNNNFKSSQATLPLTSLRDWTQEGVTKLSLWFYGDPANAPERMNVALNGTAPVYHDDPSAATIDDWTEWIIDLSAFGVPLTNVTSITIGFGIPGSTAAGGTGDMLFDDLLLIR